MSDSGPKSAPRRIAQISRKVSKKTSTGSSYKKVAKKKK